jgi:DNA-binding CsgD family transcriptional regulator
MVRNHDAGRFDEVRLAHGRRLWSHFSRAMHLFTQTEALRQRAQLGIRGLEEVELGVIATDERRRVLFANSQAEAVLGASTELKVRNAHLTVADPALDVRLGEAIADASRRSRAASLAIPAPSGGGEELLLSIAPLPESSAMRGPLTRPTALVLVRSRARQRVASAAQLMHWFGLSPAEARLARAVGHGQTPEDYSVAEGVSMSTVRTQLRAVFARTGTGRQSDLVRLVTAAPVVRERRP